MAGRGRGGRRPRDPPEEWEDWGRGWFPPPHPGYLHPPYQPPPPYGYYPDPHHPPPPLFGQFDQPHFRRRARGHSFGGRGRSPQHFNHNQRQLSPTDKLAPIQADLKHQHTESQPTKQEQNRVQVRHQDKGKQVTPSSTQESSSCVEKFPHVICFNCGDSGHFSSGCSNPRICFICQGIDHVSAECPEWKKPVTAAQFLGSANSGMGFHHIDVEAREGRFRH